jgi:hypothetical protein
MMVATRESLLTPSAVKLYGRIITALDVNVENARNELGANQFLRQQLKKEVNPKLARIYGFSYFGRYTPLSRPVIFLVHAEGEEVSAGGGAKTLINAMPLDQSGVAAKDWVLPPDIRVWEYDRGDFSLRLDIDSGPLERILIEAEEGKDEMPYFRGVRTRLRSPGE